MQPIFSVLLVLCLINIIKTGNNNATSKILKRNPLLLEILLREPPLDYKSGRKVTCQDAQIGSFDKNNDGSNDRLYQNTATCENNCKMCKSNQLIAERSQNISHHKGYKTYQQVTNQEAQVGSFNANSCNNNPNYQDVSTYANKNGYDGSNPLLYGIMQCESYQDAASQVAQSGSFDNYSGSDGRLYQNTATCEDNCEMCKSNQLIAERSQNKSQHKELKTYQQVKNQEAQVSSSNANNHNPAYKTLPMFGESHTRGPKHTSTFIHEINKSDFALLKELAEEYIRDQGFNTVDTDTTNFKQDEYDTQVLQT